MAEPTSSPSRSKDKQPEESQSAAPSGTLPPKLEGAVEMEDLTLKPAYQEDYPVAPLPEPLASNPVQPAAGGAQETPSAAQSSSQNTATPATPAEGEETTSTTTQSKGKAPAREDPLTLGHTPSEEPAAKGDMVVEILLISTAASSRHPFKITERYLTKRNVNVPGVTVDGKMDILSITVYSLKELILREWRREWETAPREPASIRLIRLGKMLDDKATLQSYGFSLEAPNVVHMTVKPQETEEEGGAAKGAKEAGPDNNEAGCCCIVL